jgi:hypothetical protein
MQAADFRDGDDSSDSARPDWARFQAILAKREMRAGSVVVVDIRG